MGLHAGKLTENDETNPVVEGRTRKMDCGQITDGSAVIFLASPGRASRRSPAPPRATTSASATARCARGRAAGQPAGPARGRAPRLRAAEGGERGRAKGARPGARRGSEAPRRDGERVGGVQVLVAATELGDQKALLDLANRIQSRSADPVVQLLGGGSGDKSRWSRWPARARWRRDFRRRSWSAPRRAWSAGRGRPRRHGQAAARTRPSSTTRWRRRARSSRGSWGSYLRVLALDHGTVRIGAAICDPTGTLTTPLPVIEPPEPASVVMLVREREVERVVVGLPVHLSGAEGSQAALARTFTDELQAPPSTSRSTPMTSGSPAGWPTPAGGPGRRRRATRSPRRTCSTTT